MSLYFRKADILNSSEDAIVITNNQALKLGGVMGNSLLKRCGQKIQDELNQIGSCKTTQCVHTESYGLKCKYIIHVAGPIFESGLSEEYTNLKKTFDNVFQYAKSLGCTSIAVPLISSGAFCYPTRDVCEIAIERANLFLKNNNMKICITIFSDKTFDECKDLFKKYEQKVGLGFIKNVEYKDYIKRLAHAYGSNDAIEGLTYSPLLKYKGLYKEGKKTFADALKEIMNKKGVSTSALSSSSYVSVKTISKLTTGTTEPKLSTLVAIGLALELSLSEFEILLKLAGKSFNLELVFDQIAYDFFKNKIFKVDKFNGVLIMCGLKPVGTKYIESNS